MECPYLNWEGAVPPDSSAWGRMLIEKGFNFLVLVEGSPSMTNDELKVKEVLPYRVRWDKKQALDRIDELRRQFVGKPYSAWLQQFDGWKEGKPDWKDAPEWANWLVQTHRGDWLWFEDEPVHTEIGYLLGNTSGLRAIAYEAPLGTVVEEYEWKNSIERKHDIGETV